MKIDTNSLYLMIGENVKRKRISLGITQLEMALELGMKSTTFISEAERGKNKHFNLEQVIKLSYYFNCKIDDLAKYPENHSEWLDESIYNED